MNRDRRAQHCNIYGHSIARCATFRKIHKQAAQRVKRAARLLNLGIVFIQLLQLQLTATKWSVNEKLPLSSKVIMWRG